jgi:TonB family protein
VQRFEVCDGRSFRRRALLGFCLGSALFPVLLARLEGRPLGALPPADAVRPAGSDDQKSDKKSGADDDAVTETVYNVGGDVKPPRVVHRVMPEFTEKSREQHIEGSVVLVTVVTSKGEAHQIRVQKSLDKELDQKAIEALRQWQFQPGEKDNKPVATRVSIEIRFNVL